MIRRIEMRQHLPMRIRPPRPHQDRLDARVLPQIHPERLLHRLRIPRQIQPVRIDGPVDKLVDFGERVRRDDVHGLQFGGQGGGRVVREGGEEEDEEDEAVFAAVVGEGDFGEAGGLHVSIDCFRPPG